MTCQFVKALSNFGTELQFETMVRIGVVADTHCPEFLDELPPSLFERLRGVDLILHAGDVGGPETLARLAEVAPVAAVRGDHDSSLTDLPLSRELNVDGHKIAVVHGNRGRWLEEPVTFIGTISLGLIWPKARLQGALRRRFPDADVIVYGHTHKAAAHQVGGALVFNPGAVYMVTAEEAERRLARRPGWFVWSWLQVIRHRRDRPVRSVGILELEDGQLRARVVPL